jgi:hypothetical protein
MQGGRKVEEEPYHPKLQQLSAQSLSTLLSTEDSSVTALIRSDLISNRPAPGQENYHLRSVDSGISSRPTCHSLRTCDILRFHIIRTRRIRITDNLTSNNYICYTPFRIVRSRRLDSAPFMFTCDGIPAGQFVIRRLGSCGSLSVCSRGSQPQVER